MACEYHRVPPMQSHESSGLCLVRQPRHSETMLQTRAAERVSKYWQASFARLWTCQWTWIAPSGADNSFADMVASNFKLKNPTIISSQLCCPQITDLVGSGFSGLFGELSK